MTLKEWIEKQKEIESFATEGCWSFKRRYDANTDFEVDKLDENDGELRSSSGTSIIQSWDYEGYSSGIYIRSQDLKKIENACNNYRKVLEALEIAVDTLDRHEFTYHVEQIKKKLGVE